MEIWSWIQSGRISEEQRKTGKTKVKKAGGITAWVEGYKEMKRTE